MYRIAHIGAFNFKNLGDLLFVDVLERQLHSRLGEIEIELFSPLGGELPVRNKPIYPINDLEERYLENRFDALVIGGGDFIHFQKIIAHVDSYAEDPVIYDVLYMWVIPALVSWRHRVPLLWNAPGAPLHFERFQCDIARDLCRQASYLSVRDEHAAEELYAIGLSSSELVVVPDTVLCISRLFSQEELNACLNLSEQGIRPNGYVFFQCNMSFTDEELLFCSQQLLRLKTELGLEILLQPIGYGIDDCEALGRLDALCPGAYKLSNRAFNQYAILALLSNCACYIGSSLHGCIIASSFSKPNILINKNHYNKSDGLIELLGHPNSLIHEVDDLPDAIGGLFTQRLGVGEKVLERIEAHFDVLADYIHAGQAEASYRLGLDVSIAEYIYRMGELERELQVVKSELQTEIENRTAVQQDNVLLREKNDLLDQEIRCLKESTSWKVTKPIRELKRRLG